MRATKIVFIGAGSADFGPKILGDIMQAEELNGSTLALVDINAEGLELMAKLARRMNREWGTGLRIESSVDRKRALKEAEFVIVSIARDREKCWRQDWEIPLKYGIRQPLGENGGPGAVAHTCRNAPMIYDICKDMERLCPKAWLLNFTNPVPRMCIVATRYTGIKAVGLCHQIGMGYRILSQVLDIRDEELDVKAAGINHFTWMLDIRHKDTGEDLYPLFRKRLKDYDPKFQPLSRDLLKAFGLFPATGDGHLSEYTHWTHDPIKKPWEKYHLHLYDWDRAERRRDEQWKEIERMARGESPIDGLRVGSGERAIHVILGILGNLNSYELAVDIPNRGYIGNLPDGAIVEVPAVVSGLGVNGIGVGNLPEAIASLCRTQITVAELAVKAGITGDRNAALQALLVDPMVNDIETAEKILDEFLRVQKDYLPQFRK
ncbi:MAG: family 4 glycosyl hydrolase [bacterium]